MKLTREQQNAAAGGQHNRKLYLPNGQVVIASVSVRRFKRSRQQYGYVQFKSSGRTVTRYIGNVTAPSYVDSLRIGWRLLRKRKVIEESGWKWARDALR